MRAASFFLYIYLNIPEGFNLFFFYLTLCHASLCEKKKKTFHDNNGLNTADRYFIN